MDRNLVLLPGVRRENGSPSSRRAWIEIPSYWSKATEAPVALLAEGVDRNNNKAIPDLMKMVALLAEGVDRNCIKDNRRAVEALSPSSRRAWIEIDGIALEREIIQSPSSRRAWIEMLKVVI